jgi:protein-S-isoprenylcysteine O-methyltransferase Ste14
MGVIIAIIGLPIYAESLPGLLVMLLLIPLILIRIRFEEKMLTEHFSDAYREYRRTTRKLIPFVY